MKTMISVLLLAAAVVLSSASNAQAQAEVFIDFYGCNLLDGNGGFVFTSDTHVVITNNPNGNVKLTCRATVTPSVSGTAVQYNFDSTANLCGAIVCNTNRWHETVSASGQATLQCMCPSNP